MAATPVEKSFCTTTEAARLLGVSVATAQLWAESGMLQAWKTAGGHRRIQRESVQRLLYSGQVAELGAPLLAPAGQAVRGLRVLVVDDDEFLLELYRVHIAAWSPVPELHVVNNPYAALLMMGRTVPELLVLDLQMPDMDGFRMLQMLHHAPEARDVRIVVATALDAHDIAQRGGIPPGIEILAKPVPFPRLQAIGRELLLARSQPALS
jgi:excisionase family DNA binding protein